MTTTWKTALGTTAVIAALIGCVAPASAQTTVTVLPGANWLGFMNVSELPENGGAFVFGSGWGTADLVATFSGDELTLAPNQIGDPDPFWYQGGGGPGAPGNKIMEANMYVEETGTLNGQTVTFTGNVLSNTFTSAHDSVAFIRDFAPDYSSFDEVTVPLTPGVFSISLATNADPGRHVQYGFTTTGVNVWATDVAPFGTAVITAVPEPATIGLLACAVAMGVTLRRRG